MYRFIWKIRLYDHIADDDFIANWHYASMVLQEYPGAKGTRIHRMHGEERSYFLVAEWAFKEARDDMQAEIDAGETERAQRYAAFPANDTFGEIIMMAGSEIGAVMPIPEDVDLS
jgi:hypothetical protein